MSDRYCITLVHGTRLFGNLAPTPTWVEDSSALCRTLRSELGEEAKIESFRWSGRNDHEGRAKAASYLAGDISGRLDADPDAVHAIIAHSHGGNIALAAAADPRIANRVGKVVCLSTPFFHPGKRDMVTIVLNFIIVYLGFFGVTTLLLLAMYSIPRVAWLVTRRFEFIRSTSEFNSWRLAAVAALAVAVLLWCLRKRIAAWVARRQQRKIEEITLPRRGSASVLCVWANGDEVLLGFRWLDRLAGLTLLLLRPWSVAITLVLIAVWLLSAKEGDAIFKLLAFGTAFFGLIARALYPFAILWEYIAEIAHIPVKQGIPVAIVIMTFMTVTLLSAISFFAAAIVHIVLKLVPFGMTDWRFLDTFFLRIAPGPTPQDREGVDAEEMRLSGRLRHSAVYKSEEAAKKIAAFIRRA